MGHRSLMETGLSRTGLRALTREHSLYIPQRGINACL